jgi:ubiquinone/menaquinone biosynthesis C-methylase UbiE
MLFESRTQFVVKEAGIMQIKDTRQRLLKMPRMEGAIARWYAGLRRSGSQMREYRVQALRLTAALEDGATILEVAPGPGYLATEVARLGRYRVTGLDVSHSFVAIAGDYAQREGQRVDFQQGDAAALPFPAESFDLVVCQAAFKNFAQPNRALDEMHRVLRPGGTAVIQDMCRDTTGSEIDAEVKQMALSPLSAFMTRRTLGMLRHRAYSRGQFERLAAGSAFGTCTISADGIGMEVRLTKPAAATSSSTSAA